MKKTFEIEVDVPGVEFGTLELSQIPLLSMKYGGFSVRQVPDQTELLWGIASLLQRVVNTTYPSCPIWEDAQFLINRLQEAVK